MSRPKKKKKEIKSRITYIFTRAGIQTDEIGVVATEMSRVNNQGLKDTGRAQLDLDPIMMLGITGATGLPTIPGVVTLGGQDDVGGFAVAVVTGLDHTGTVRERSQVKNLALFREDGGNVSIDAEAGLIRATI